MHLYARRLSIRILAISIPYKPAIAMPIDQLETMGMRDIAWRPTQSAEDQVINSQMADYCAYATE